MFTQIKCCMFEKRRNKNIDTIIKKMKSESVFCLLDFGF